jgi:hypothetical protein
LSCDGSSGTAALHADERMSDAALDSFLNPLLQLMLPCAQMKE